MSGSVRSRSRARVPPLANASPHLGYLSHSLLSGRCGWREILNSQSIFDSKTSKISKISSCPKESNSHLLQASSTRELQFHAFSSMENAEGLLKPTFSRRQSRVDRKVVCHREQCLRDERQGGRSWPWMQRRQAVEHSKDGGGAERKKRDRERSLNPVHWDRE